IKPTFTASSWRAEAISAHSMAERVGVKAGDMIEAINDQPLSEKTVFGNKFDGKSLRIRRDGKSMQIELKP
ncbi:MAG: PDZ domain-containing protein, partial [Acidobacteriota bacterium]